MDPSDLRCAVCMEEYGLSGPTEPYVLPNCYHTFCLA